MDSSILPLVITIWAVCAVASGVIAMAKGQHVIDALLTAFVGFFLGPIGVLLALADSPENHV